MQTTGSSPDLRRDAVSDAGRLFRWWALAVAVLHTWLALTRHIWAAENNMTKSPFFMGMLAADLWLTVGLAGSVVLWVAFSLIFLRSARHAQAPLLRRCLTPEWIIFTVLFLWFIVTLTVYSGRNSLLLAYWHYVIDTGVCALVLLPLGILLGVRRGHRVVRALFLVILGFATAFVSMALVSLFLGIEIKLPNGMFVRLAPNGAVRLGVNTNIGAGICFAMVCASLYLIFTHRGVARAACCAVMLPHLAYCLLSGSRACFLALLLTLTPAAGMLAWQGTRRLCRSDDAKKRAAVRLAVSVLAGVLCCAALLLLRPALMNLLLDSLRVRAPKALEQVTKAVYTEESLTTDSSRSRIWPAVLHIMTQNPRQFVFGLPRGYELQNAIKDTLIALYGKGSVIAHAHNQVLQVGARQGVPAMAAYIATLVLTAVRCVRILVSPRKRARLKGCEIIPVCMLGMVFFSIFEPFLWMYFSAMGCVFFLLDGLLIAVDRGYGAPEEPAEKDGEPSPS